jgi:AraC-like DNA-binding protein
MDRRVIKLIEAINCHSGAMDWNLERACHELQLEISPAYAARIFKRHTGTSIREYAKRQRLLISTQRLTATDLLIKAIATDLGYRQASDFSRFFRRQKLLNPTRFRRLAR